MTAGPDLDALRAAHGEVLTFAREGEVAFVCKRPDRATMRLFMSMSMQDPGGALDALVENTRVWPEKAAFDAFADRWPGLVLHAGTQLSAQVGMGQARLEGE